VIVRGRIVGAAPVIYGRARDGRLYLGSRGDLPLVIDTGFTGTLALPPSMARQLNCQFVAVDTYTLAADVEVELPMYVGSLQIGARRVDTWFIVGDALIGMELLQQVCSHVHIDLLGGTVELSL
jgi:predicted aspartyl protease